MSSTRASSSTRTPPNVNVIPHVIGNAVNGGCSTGSAQLDLGGSMPSVRLPSLTVGSKSPGPIAALNASTVRSRRSASMPSRSASSPSVSASTRVAPGAS